MSNPEALEKIFQKLEQESERRAALAQSAQEAQVQQVQQKTSFSHINFDANAPPTPPFDPTKPGKTRNRTAGSSLSSHPSSERLRSLPSRERLRPAPSSERLRAPASSERLRTVPSSERLQSAPASSSDKFDSTLSSPTSLSPAPTPAMNSPRSEVQSLSFTPAPMQIERSESSTRSHARDRERRRGSISITRFGQLEGSAFGAQNTTSTLTPINGNGNGNGTTNGTGPSVGFASIYPANSQARTQSTDSISSTDSDASLTHRLESEHITQIQTIAPRSSIPRSVGDIIARKLTRSKSKASLIGGGGLDGSVVIGVVVEEKTSSASLELDIDLDSGVPKSPISPTGDSHQSANDQAFIRPESRGAVVALHTLNAPPPGKKSRIGLNANGALGDKLRRRATVRDGQISQGGSSLRFATIARGNTVARDLESNTPSVSISAAETTEGETDPVAGLEDENALGWVDKAKDLGKKWKRRSTMLFGHGGSAGALTVPPLGSSIVPASAPTSPRSATTPIPS